MKKFVVILCLFVLIIINIATLGIVYADVYSSESVTLDFIHLIDYFNHKIDVIIKNENIPGVSLAIVKGNQVFTKGFGFADNNDEVLVTEDTIFKIASITKLFTALGVMQLVEQQHLDLDRDIREFLEGFEYESEYNLTLRNLLTHTSGFDESIIDYYSLNYGSDNSLEKFIFENQPKLIRNPGKFTQYNNYALSLVGYIIEQISGVDYKEYVKDNIFFPLDMTNTSFNFENTTESEIAREYIYKEESLKPVHKYSLDAFPAGSITSSANDMAKFLLAMVNTQTSQKEGILKSETLKVMQSKQFSNQKNIAGVCYGFIENIKNGHRFIGHGGSLIGVNSELLIDLENELGIFIVANSNSSNEVTIELLEDFIEKFYPFELETYNNKIINNKNINGKYYNNRFSRETIEKLQLLVYPQIRVKTLDQTSIEVSGLGPTKEYQHIKDLLFIDESTGRKVAFKSKDDKVYLYPFLPDWTLTKFKFHQDPLLHIILISITLLVFIINIFLPIINKLVRNKKVKRIKKLSFLISVVNLLFLALIICQLINMSALTEIGFGIKSSLKMLFILPLVSFLLLLVQLTFLIIAIIRKDFVIKKHIFDLISIVSFSVFIVVLNFYNLIGFKF